MDIKDSIFKFLRLDNLVKSLSGYLETRVELVKIEVREEIIKVVSHGLMIGFCFLLAMLFLVFLTSAPIMEQRSPDIGLWPGPLD